MFVSYSRFSLVELDTSPVAPFELRNATLEIKVGFALLVGKSSRSSIILADFVKRNASVLL